jgi:AcrR family transcriptional regulator
VPALDTRQRILQSSLRCFLEHGYDQTTVSLIRQDSGVSNGALFHHFPSKEAIADALYVDAIGSFQEGLWQLLADRPPSLQAAVRGVIAHQLSWIEQHPEQARFVYMRGHLDWGTPAASTVASLNRELADAIRERIAPLRERGAVRPVSMLVLTAIVSGPAHLIAQRWLAGQLRRRPSSYVGELADAAFAALGAGRSTHEGRSPGTAAGADDAPAAAVPASGRISLELLSADGEVLAHAQASAPLEPDE